MILVLFSSMEERKIVVVSHVKAINTFMTLKKVTALAIKDGGKWCFSKTGTRKECAIHNIFSSVVDWRTDRSWEEVHAKKYNTTTTKWKCLRRQSSRTTVEAEVDHSQMRDQKYSRTKFVLQYTAQFIY